MFSFRPRVLSLFSGCGGLDLGFHKAGFVIVYANDISPAVKATYEYNLGKIDICDIRKIDKKSLPDCDVILAGIPCQPFSSAGNRGSMNDDRGVLFREVIDTLKTKRPKIVLLENVRGFLSAKDNNGITMPERIRKELDKNGYILHYKLLNSADYQVPQNRYRVILLGVRKDISHPFSFPEPVTDKSNLTVGSVLSLPLPPDEQAEIWPLSPQSMRIAQFVPEGGALKDIPLEEMPPRFKPSPHRTSKHRSRHCYRRFARSEIMGTITAAATPENSGIIHPLENRRYSVREIARFQSFPDEFKFVSESIPQKYKMIGNAVPVNLAFHLAKSILEVL